MASSARMDELRKKFDENPRRYFAPLANEYRKVGDLEQAIFICQEYLPQQPGHMSGHIVYGQALFESGRQDEARAVFETALALDPENLIALRHLGDIARDTGDVPTARQWYQRVLEADPRNEEISALLAALPPDAATPSFHEAPTVEVPAVQLDAPAPAAEQLERSSDAPSPSSRGSEATEGPALPDETPVYEQALDLELTLPGSPPPAPEPTMETVVEATVDFVDAEPAAASPADGLLDLEDFAIPGSAPDVANTQDLSLSDPYGGVLGAASEEQDAGAALEFVDTSAPVEPEPVAEPQQPAQTFVTETMAELYLRQGHTAEALDIYDQLLAQRPYDDALAARAAAARQQALGDAGPTIREFLRGIFHRNAGGDGGTAWTGDAAATGRDDAMASALARGFGPQQS